jgi:hypothetical protein
VLSAEKYAGLALNEEDWRRAGAGRLWPVRSVCNVMGGVLFAQECRLLPEDAEEGDGKVMGRGTVMRKLSDVGERSGCSPESNWLQVWSMALAPRYELF